MTIGLFDFMFFACLFVVIVASILLSYTKIGGCLTAIVLMWIIIIAALIFIAITLNQGPPCYTVWSGSCT